MKKMAFGTNGLISEKKSKYVKDKTTTKNPTIWGAEKGRKNYREKIYQRVNKSSHCENGLLRNQKEKIGCHTRPVG